MKLMGDIRACRCCKTRRAAEEKMPRLLVPVELMNNRTLWLCTFCDGDSFADSKKIEERLMTGDL